MTRWSLSDANAIILSEGAVFDPRSASVAIDPYRTRARSFQSRPETEGYLWDESDGWFVPEEGYLARLAGNLNPGKIAEQWFGNLRGTVLDGYWHDKRLVLEPLERAALDLVVIGGRPTRGALYRALVAIQKSNPRFQHTPNKSLSQNAHEAIGVPTYARLVAMWT